MKRADLRTDGTEYAVSYPSERAELGSIGIRRCVVLSTDQAPREVFTGRYALPSKTRDGVHVRSVDGRPLTWDADTAVVRPQAIKGTWDEHLRVKGVLAERALVARESKEAAERRFRRAVSAVEGLGLASLKAAMVNGHLCAVLDADGLEALADLLRDRTNR